MPKKVPKVDANFTIFVDSSFRIPTLNKMAQVPSPDIHPTLTANLDPPAEKQPKVEDYPMPETKPSPAQRTSEEHDFPSSNMSQDGHDFHMDTRQESSESHAPHQMHSRNSSEDTVQHEDDIFSDNGDRSNSSLGSVDGAREGDTQTSTDNKDDPSRQYSFEFNHNSDRILSGVSGISRFTQYDKDFVPTYRDTRKPFRTPSEIRAMQMSSPTVSTFNGSSSRLSKRQAANTSPFPTVSRVGSPKAQHTPKGRATPTRFKPQEAPLVLLHVTLLPLRWVWGDVLNGLDAVNGKALDENRLPFIASEQLKTLRDSWRELQDRVSNNVLERGILLPHPQNDFEVLEERLLEALELPVKRRARILECGHYLGPSNMDSLLEEESDDDSSSTSSGDDEYKKHWCIDCKSEIRFEHLGSKKVFRVKVFASNGLMKAGAWDACWNQMERVDVEVEPVVDSTLHGELEKLGVIEIEYEEQRQQEVAMEPEPEPVPVLKSDFMLDPEGYLDRPKSRQSNPPVPLSSARDQSRMMSRPGTARPASVMDNRRPMSSQRPASASPDRMGLSDVLHPPEILSPSRPRAQSRLHVESIDESEERRLRDEERLREIYEGVPSTEASDVPAAELDSHALAIISSSPNESHTRPPTAHSPNQEYHEPQYRQKQSRFNIENPSFTDLLTEAFRVALDNGIDATKDLLATLKNFCKDGKNVAIVVLTLLVVVIALGGRGKQDMVPAVYRREPSTGDHPISPPRIPVIGSAPEASVEVSTKQLVEVAALGSMDVASHDVVPVVHGGMSELLDREMVYSAEPQQVTKPVLDTLPKVSKGVSSAEHYPSGIETGVVNGVTVVPLVDAHGVYADQLCQTGKEQKRETLMEPAVLGLDSGESDAHLSTVHI
ncbi:hypothetical protein QBC43DRAFT_290241 [Cladorrhinum sp. PSN259]|nr:hypothetical protein QBC43DRAFT_290241 [Cladorrhinum sp. PSN259]